MLNVWKSQCSSTNISDNDYEKYTDIHVGKLFLSKPISISLFGWKFASIVIFIDWCIFICTS